VVIEDGGKLWSCRVAPAGVLRPRPVSEERRADAVAAAVVQERRQSKETGWMEMEMAWCRRVGGGGVDVGAVGVVYVMSQTQLVRFGRPTS